ncbi:MAG: hypothetical protein RL531_1134 [Actinomycetota bacterium]
MQFGLESLGRWTDPVETTIERDGTIAYAAATNDPIAAHLAGDQAPPIYAVVPVWGTMSTAMMDVVPPDALAFVVHGEQDMRFHRAITPGMTLRSRAAAVGVHVKPNGTTVVVKVESRDAADDGLVVEQYVTTFYRGVTGGDGAGEEAPDHKLTAAVKAGGTGRDRRADHRHRPDLPVRGCLRRSHADPPRRRVRDQGRSARDHHPRSLHDGVHLLGRDLGCGRRRPDPPPATRRAVLAARAARPDHRLDVLGRGDERVEPRVRLRDPHRRGRRRDQGRSRRGVGLTASARVRLFAAAREAAGAAELEVPVGPLGALLDDLVGRAGPDLAAVLAVSRVWVNGQEPVRGRETEVCAGDEVAILPPVSGG